LRHFVHIFNWFESNRNLRQNRSIAGAWLLLIALSIKIIRSVISCYFPALGLLFRKLISQISKLFTSSDPKKVAYLFENEELKNASSKFDKTNWLNSDCQFLITWMLFDWNWCLFCLLFQILTLFQVPSKSGKIF